jgi:hypothetical protein
MATAELAWAFLKVRPFKGTMAHKLEFSGKKGTHAVSLADSSQRAVCLPRFRLSPLYSKSFIAEPQTVSLLIIFFILSPLLPFLPTLTPNGGRAEDQ